jgi:hypothetical protein
MAVAVKQGTIVNKKKRVSTPRFSPAFWRGLPLVLRHVLSYVFSEAFALRQVDDTMNTEDHLPVERCEPAGKAANWQPEAGPIRLGKVMPR